ncbi:MAG: hypothetical protein ACP5GJ_00685 [Nanopusillaceae archaeon]
MKKGISGEIIKIIVIVIVFIFLFLVLFNILKAASYSGRLQAKFAYALSGSVSFLVNKPAQFTHSLATDAGEIYLGGMAAVATIGMIAAVLSHNPSAAEEAAQMEKEAGQSAEILEEGQMAQKGVESWYNKYSNLESSSNNYETLKSLAKGAANALRKVYGNPIAIGIGSGIGSAWFLSSSYITNGIAGGIQGPILYYLAPEGVIFVDFNNQQQISYILDEMDNDLNKSFVNEINSNCNNNYNSPSCENIIMTYLIAKYLYYTWGETLGQSVAIAGTHNEYFIAFMNYDSSYNVTQEGVLCMLGMMNYYGTSPLKQMYENNLSSLLNEINYDGDIVCQIAGNVLDISLPSPSEACGTGDANIPDKITQMDVFESYVVENNQLQQYNCGKIPEDYNVLINATSSSYYSGYIQYTYDGGTQGVIVSIVFGGGQ